MARQRGFQGRTASHRLTQWVAPANQGYLAVASGGATLISSFVPGEALTITRIRGQVSVIPNPVSADLDVVGAIGEGVVSAEAFAAGVGSIPEPFTDGDWGGWMSWRAFSFHLEFSDGTGLNFVDWTFEVDSKAQRRIGSNEVLVQICESQVGGFFISAPMRTLVKLS